MMSEPPVAKQALRVATCSTDESLRMVSDLFNQYRHVYGESSVHDARASEWLVANVRSHRLTVCAAYEDASPVGFATSHVIPASLVMGESWQLRDLYVHPQFRRRGVAAALVVAVRDAARSADATRLSLVTEPGNRAALSLYERLGFTPIDALTSLSLDLRSTRSHN